MNPCGQRCATLAAGSTTTSALLVQLFAFRDTRSRCHQPAKYQHAARQNHSKQRCHIEAGLGKNSNVPSQTHQRGPLCSISRDDRWQRSAAGRVPAARRYPLELRPRCLILLAAFSFPLFLTSCAGNQSALDPRGKQAEVLAGLFWTFTIILALVWFVTMVGLLLAILRRRLREEPAERRGVAQRQIWLAFYGALISTTAILIGLSVLSVGGQAAIYRREGTAVVTIKVIGHQWWWQVRYEDENTAFSFETANEIRIPVGEPVDVQLATSDVIHSFWIPSLAGKLDLIPGRENQLRIEADKPGIYRGQCAEFCGRQHAHMAMFVIALPRNEFEKWRARQRAAAIAATGSTRPG
jgi:cytochrome c oxidase subunit II